MKASGTAAEPYGLRQIYLGNEGKPIDGFVGYTKLTEDPATTTTWVEASHRLL